MLRKKMVFHNSCKILLFNVLLVGCKAPTLSDARLAHNIADQPSQVNQSATSERPTEDDGSVPGYNLVCGSVSAALFNNTPRTDMQTLNLGCRYQNTQTQKPADLNTIASVSNWSSSQPNQAVTIVTANQATTDPNWHVIFHISYPANTGDFAFSQIMVFFNYTEKVTQVKRAVSNNMQELLARYNLFSFVENDLYNKTWSGDNCWDNSHSSSAGPAYTKWFLQFDNSANLWVKLVWYDNNTCSGNPASVDAYHSYPLTFQGLNQYGALNALVKTDGSNVSYDLFGISNGVLYHDNLDSEAERANWAPILKRPDTAYHVQ